jgi:parallel beta-helix repeat protein
MRPYTALFLAAFVSACGGKDDDAPDGEGGTDTPADDTSSPGDDTGGTETMEGFDINACEDVLGDCVQIAGGDSEGLQEVTNLLSDDTTIILGEGSFLLDNQVTIRNTNITLMGQGMDLTILDFGSQAVQTNGVDAVGDGFTISDLTILDAKKDGLRIEDSDRVVIRRTRATWTDLENEENGAYGLYPVHCTNVLIDGSEAHNAADAGIYVGQSQHVIVRDSLATGNVAGIEIENTQYADVYGNTATGNTGGMLIFDLPGNPVFTRDVKVHDNIIVENNTANFAPGGTVSQIPAGTGAVILAARRVELTNNTFSTNNSTDIAIINGLAIDGNEDSWAVAIEDIVGDYEDLALVSDGTTVKNYDSSEIVIAGNTHEGSGNDIDILSLASRPIGYVIGAIYGSERVDDILYDTINESSFDKDDPALNSNDNKICLGDSTGATFASIDLEARAAELESFDFPTTERIFQPEAPFTPFNCTELTGGPIGDISITVQ